MVTFLKQASSSRTLTWDRQESPTLTGESIEMRVRKDRADRAEQEQANKEGVIGRAGHASWCRSKVRRNAWTCRMNGIV
jgi:hypothetical protein